MIEKTICGNCRQEIDVTTWFQSVRTGDLMADIQRHCLYPDGRVRWCYVDGITLVCGLDPEQFQRAQEVYENLLKQAMEVK